MGGVRDDVGGIGGVVEEEEEEDEDEEEEEEEEEELVKDVMEGVGNLPVGWCKGTTRCGTFSWQIRQFTLFGQLSIATLSSVAVVGMHG